MVEGIFRHIILINNDRQLYFGTFSIISGRYTTGEISACVKIVRITEERKVDEEKKAFLNGFKIFAEEKGGVVTNIKNEAEFSFTFGENSYTVKLVKHRPK